MTQTSIEQRVQTLEQELATIKLQLNGDKRPWWEQIWGKYANDPAFEEAMRLGREYRESLRPKPRAKGKRKSRHARARH